ncbi:integrase [Methylobacterium sp. WL6]|nr:integrase [Methylobacterium sp. WL6]
MKRHNGRLDLYWVADEKLVRAGYQPKTVRLYGDWPSREIASRCAILQAEMLEWADGRAPARNDAPPGTLAWVCRAFETDVDSPFHDRRQATRTFYSKYIRKLVDKAGDSHLADIVGRDVRRWHKEWLAEMGVRSAYACIQTLRRVVNYGCELRSSDAIELAAVLEKTEFSMPKARKRRPTFEQIVALREAAHAAGRPSIALAVAFQFELGLRQKDLIGEWTRPKADERARIVGAITDGAWVWQWGLTWNHIDASGLLEKPTSKSNGNEVATHDLRLHPEILAELPPRGVGPIIVDERSGKPWKSAHFSHTFRKIAREAGWPDTLWNMDSRAGAVSEAFEAGADPADVMRTATHTQMSTTMLYNRGGVVQSSRVAELRAARRKGVRREP